MQSAFIPAVLEPTSSLVSATPLFSSTTALSKQASGEATFYNPGLGSCGWTNRDNDMIMVIADGKPNCGKIATVNRTDTGKSIEVKVVDTCCQS